MTGFPTHLLLTQGALLGSFISDLLGTLSKDVFEPRTSTGSEAFSLFICLDANKLVLLSFFSLLKTIYPRVSTKSFPSDAKSPLPVDVRRSKTLLLKLPIVTSLFNQKRERSFFEGQELWEGSIMLEKSITRYRVLAKGLVGSWRPPRAKGGTSSTLEKGTSPFFRITGSEITWK